MPTKPIDRLLFAQGGLCYFCNVELPKAEATVEHLVASARGGSNADDNCVACCKAVNNLLGSMSLKEKVKVILNQRGSFCCPNGSIATTPAPATSKPKKPTSPKSKDPLPLLVANLRSRSKGRPTRVKALTADIKSQKLGLTDSGIADLIEKLKAQGKIVIDGTSITYKL